MNLLARTRTVAAPLVVLLAAMLGSAGLVGTAAASPAVSAGYGVPAGYTIPHNGTVRGRAAVKFALTMRGHHYRFGSTGLSYYDCSGLTMRSWAHGGKNISRTTYAQRYNGTGVSRPANLVPGDLVLVPAGGTNARPNHVGIFIGRGLVLHAPGTGDVVRAVPYDSFTARGTSGLRHIG